MLIHDINELRVAIKGRKMFANGEPVNRKGAKAFLSETKKARPADGTRRVVNAEHGVVGDDYTVHLTAVVAPAPADAEDVEDVGDEGDDC